MASLIQRSFAAGEIASSLYARADRAAFQTGLKQCRNFIVLRHGGAANRTGSQFIAEVKDSTTRTYLAKFVFNDEQAYLIEAGNGYFRFVREGAPIQVSGVTAWSALTAYVIGDLVVSGGVNYYCILAHTNHVPANATYWYPLTGTIYEIPTPYAAADLPYLQFVQSADVVTITHPSYQPRELRRTGHTSWTLALVTTAPSIAAPANLNATAGTAGALTYAYKVTAAKTETYEESEASASDSVSCAVPTAAAPNTLTWDAVSGAAEYDVYLDKDGNGVFGYAGTATSNSFNDPGIEPDLSETPPVVRRLFETSGNFPATATYYQQRRLFAGTDNEPETAQASRIGFYSNFGITSPLQEDDAVKFRTAGRKVQRVRHLIEIDGLVMLTSGGEWTIAGDPNNGGALTPTAINPEQRTHYGASRVQPMVVGKSIIYIQERGNLVRDFRYDPNAGGFDGPELSLNSAHLVDDKIIERADFAQIPHSIAWFIRNDGVMLGLTYIRQEGDVEVAAWHRHDTDGLYEDVCVIPEFNTEDAPYVIVKRTIGGVTKRYIERFPKRRAEDIRINALFSDSYLTYNGINDTAVTMTPTSAGGGWTVDDEITVTRSAAGFTAGDLGNAIVFLDADTQEVFRVNIETYTSTTVVKGRPSKTVPADTSDAVYRSVATTRWARAVDDVSGLTHLEGKTVSILADGNVLQQQTVTAGAIALGRPYSVIHAGLPITADFETLDLDVVNGQIRDRTKLVKAISLLVDASRGVMAGPDADHLNEYKNDLADQYGRAPELMSRVIELPLSCTWENTGRVLVRQTDPLPLTILAAIPTGEIGG
jgi:hypothetical protein